MSTQYCRHNRWAYKSFDVISIWLIADLLPATILPTRPCIALPTRVALYIYYYLVLVKVNELS